MSSCALRSLVITYGLQATTTAAATTTPESNDLIGSMGKNNRAVGAERILVELLEVYSLPNDNRKFPDLKF